MTRTYAPLLVAIWNDPDFLALDEGPQRAYFVANSQANMTYAGVVPFMPVSWSALAGNSTASKIRRDVKTLEDANFVLLDRTTEELWVKSFIKHNKVLSQPNVEKAMKASYETIRSRKIKQAVYRSVPESHRTDMSNPFGPTDPPHKTEPLREGFAEGFAHPNGKGVDPTQGYGSRESVVSGFEPAPEPKPSPEPSPAPEPEPVTPTAPHLGERTRVGVDQARPESAPHRTEEQRIFAWTDTAMDLFGFPTSKFTPTQRVMRLACAKLDDKLIDECLHYCAGRAETEKVRAPKYLHVALHRWAAQYGIMIPPPLEAAS